MDDDKIKDLFNDFHPELSSSFLFMDRLKKNMEVVEIVRQQRVALKRLNRIAVSIAAFCGFVMGVILTLLFSLVGDWVSTINVSLPHLHISTLIIDYSFMAWFVMAGVCVITALNAYEIAMVRLTLLDSRATIK